jgi:hypothetical protein
MIPFKKILKVFLWIILVIIILFISLSFKKVPEKITYGVSFSKFHSDELKLPWKDVYSSILDDLKVRHLRLSAHWPMIEPEEGQFNFEDLDYQMKEANKRGASVILAIGRRLPGWPECHEPDWVQGLSWEKKRGRILLYIEAVVNRYKEYKNIKYWQVENEPFLSVFAQEHCGKLDKTFLEEEIALVKKLDSEKPVLVTDSGNLGLWKGAWRAGDAFGTSVYIYLWNPSIGQVRTVYLPSFYKIKTNLMELLFGKKKSILIELSLEPWLLEPIVDTPIESQNQRMDINKFEEIITFAKKTGFEEQYLWGAEWWYWMKTQGDDGYWKKAKEIFSK